MKRTINEKGITLVALVITVVVLLILAGVAISTINETGIIAKSNDAAAKFNASQVNESENLIGYEDLIDKYGKELNANYVTFYIEDVEYRAKYYDDQTPTFANVTITKVGNSGGDIIVTENEVIYRKNNTTYNLVYYFYDSYGGKHPHTITPNYNLLYNDNYENEYILVWRS